MIRSLFVSTALLLLVSPLWAQGNLSQTDLENEVQTRRAIGLLGATDTLGRLKITSPLFWIKSYPMSMKKIWPRASFDIETQQ